MRRSNASGGILALLALGGIVLYRNRERVREVLGRQGIRVPHREEIYDRIRFGAKSVIKQVKEQQKEVFKEAA
jgi:hypothetical protein